jgi:predicted GIY-YIG superfamily endonuclease
VSEPGLIYLLHFERPIGDLANPRAQARHYIGFTQNKRTLAQRLEHHREGRGARLVHAFVRAGIAFEVARTWPGTRDDERWLKNRKKASRLCPYCLGGTNGTGREEAST